MYTTLDLSFITNVSVARDNTTITQESHAEDDPDMVVLYSDEIDAFIETLVEAKHQMEKLYAK